MLGNSKNLRVIILDKLVPLKKEKVTVLSSLPQQCCLLFLFKNPNSKLQLNL